MEQKGIRWGDKKHSESETVLAAVILALYAFRSIGKTGFIPQRPLTANRLTAKGLGRCGKRDKSEDLPLRASHRRCYAICTREYRANQTNGKGEGYSPQAVFDLKEILSSVHCIGEFFMLASEVI